MGVFDPHLSSRLRSIPTNWSVVRGLTAPAPEILEASWTYLVETYREPMIRYARSLLARRLGRAVSHEEGEDLVQAYLARCVKDDWLSRADRGRAPFRAFVQITLRRHVNEHMERVKARKRTPPAGSREVPSLPEADQPVSSSGAEEALEHLDRGWVEAAVEKALERLGEDFPRDAEVIRDLLISGGEGSADLAERMALSRKQLDVIRFRARKRISTLLQEELRATAQDDETFEEEWRTLRVHFP